MDYRYNNLTLELKSTLSISLRFPVKQPPILLCQNPLATGFPVQRPFRQTGGRAKPLRVPPTPVPLRPETELVPAGCAEVAGGGLSRRFADYG